LNYAYGSLVVPFVVAILFVVVVLTATMVSRVTQRASKNDHY
jgi:hypothetical protein